MDSNAKTISTPYSMNLSTMFFFSMMSALGRAMASNSSVTLNVRALLFQSYYPGAGAYLSISNGQDRHRFALWMRTGGRDQLCMGRPISRCRTTDRPMRSQTRSMVRDLSLFQNPASSKKLTKLTSGSRGQGRPYLWDPPRCPRASRSGISALRRRWRRGPRTGSASSRSRSAGCSRAAGPYRTGPIPPETPPLYIVQLRERARRATNKRHVIDSEEIMTGKRE